MKKLRYFTSVIYVILTCFSVTVKAQDKYALIIGNDSYIGSFETLTTCANDADEMNRCLKELGYITTILKNATRQQMSDAFKAFNKSISNNKPSVGVFFYSGHAMIVDGVQFLIPAKTNINLEDGSIRNDCIEISEIKWSLKRNCKYSFLFLDACRNVKEFDNYTKGSWQEAIDVKFGDGNQQMICFATGLGQVARTGTGELSPFTKVLTSHLFDKEDFSYIWNQRIVDEVFVLGKQRPVKEDDFYSSFHFNKEGIESIYDKEESKQEISEKVAITFNVIPECKIKFGDSEFESGTRLLFTPGKTYTYVIEHDGYQRHTGKIDVDKTSPSSVNIRLQKVSESSMKVYAVKPKNITVYLDDKKLGAAPLTIKTNSGNHTLRFRANKGNFYSQTKSIYLKPGSNNPIYVKLNRSVPDYFEFNTNDQAHHINYHFSPKYALGLSYLYSLYDLPISLGAMVAASPRVFSGIGQSPLVYSQGTPITTTVAIEDEAGKLIDATINKTPVTDWKSNKYSSFIDPNNEAARYDASYLLLGNIGFNPCNGIMIEAGLGAACLQNRYYMSTMYNITKTTVINNLTGESINDPVYEYSPIQGTDKWYKDDPIWTCALRFGGRFYIPLDGFMENTLTIGGGYIYLPSYKQHSSWDLTIGFCRFF